VIDRMMNIVRRQIPMENVGLIFETKYKDKRNYSYYKLIFYLVGSKFFKNNS
jgi:hypothetical protein